jgi:tRNA-specific 2-thiouridylase
MHWISGVAPPAGQPLSAMTRYRMVPAPCRIDVQGVGRWRAEFDAPQWAPTPGQYLVAYDGDVCVGGAVIEEVAMEGAAIAKQAALA